MKTEFQAVSAVPKIKITFLHAINATTDFSLHLIILNVLLVKKHGNTLMETTVSVVATLSHSANTVLLETMISNVLNALETTLCNSCLLICLMDHQLLVDAMHRSLCLLTLRLYLILIAIFVLLALGELIIALCVQMKAKNVLSVKTDTLKIKTANAPKIHADHMTSMIDVLSVMIKQTLVSFTKLKTTLASKNAETFMFKFPTMNASFIALTAGTKTSMNASNVTCKTASIVLTMENVLNVRMTKFVIYHVILIQTIPFMTMKS